MSTRNSVTAALILLLSVLAAYADGINNTTQDGINGQFGNGIWLPSSGSGVTPPLVAPVVVAGNICNITAPVTAGVNVTLIGGGTCTYTATCNGLPCTGGNALTSCAITSQSTANAFAITNACVLQGGSAAAGVTIGNSYTVTVTATNSTGTSPPQVETINVPPVPSAPVVTAATCNITVPVTTGSPVGLQGGGNCVFTALCAGVPCVAGNAITSWALVSQTCTNCFALDNSGDVLGGSAPGGIVDGDTYTMTVTATNAIGTSPQRVQTLIPPLGVALLLEAAGANFLLLEDGVSHLCLETATTGC